ncbi:MAG TPA: c-type cytochrome [Opitutus sp.]|nr:c-type cytochrome [Opitutus sp.]
MKAILGAALAAIVLLGTGCGEKLDSTSRFRLPRGNPEHGKAAFVTLNCTECHSVAGVADLPKPTVEPTAVIVLGGEVARLRTVGDLLTAIVHPAFSISEKMKVPRDKAPAETTMRDVNDRMTVRQMIDLVSFLQPQYKQFPPPENLDYYTL